VEHQKKLTDLAVADLAAVDTETGDSGMGLVHQIAQFRGTYVRTYVRVGTDWR
jgi:hypothetical protein